MIGKEIMENLNTNETWVDYFNWEKGMDETRIDVIFIYAC